jgi:hypothetical protein
MIDANVSANGVELPTDINGVAGSDLRAALAASAQLGEDGESTGQVNDGRQSTGQQPVWSNRSTM